MLLNGLRLKPSSSTSKLVLDEPAKSLGTTGGYALRAGSVGPLSKGDLDETGIAWNAAEPLLQLGGPGDDMGDDIAGAAAIANTKGVAACGSAFGVAVGGYQRWGGSNGHLWACDIDTLRAKVATARAARSGSGGVELGDPRQAMIRFTGAGAPPDVDVTGPGGRTIVMPPAGQNLGGVDGEYVVVRDPSTNRTSVIVDEPGKGRWRYATREGSAAVRTVQTAGSIEDPEVRATVVRAKKGRRRCAGV